MAYKQKKWEYCEQCAHDKGQTSRQSTTFLDWPFDRDTAKIEKSSSSSYRTEETCST